MVATATPPSTSPVSEARPSVFIDREGPAFRQGRLHARHPGAQLRLRSHAGWVAGCRVGAPIHGHEAGRLLDAPQPSANGRKGGKVEIALIGDMGVTKQRDIGDGELAGSEKIMGLKVI